MQGHKSVRKMLGDIFFGQLELKEEKLPDL
jgi:hypothetical protein